MKMKSVLIVSAMIAVGMVGTTSAGVDGPPTEVHVYCSEEPAEVCLDGDLLEVELKCNFPDTLEPSPFSVLYVGPDLPTPFFDWNLNVVLQPVEGDVPEPFLICGGTGPHILHKTEGKCTDQPHGPTKGNKKHNTGGFDGYAVEYEIKTIESNYEGFPDPT